MNKHTATTESRRRIVVVGGGVTGLAAAYRLHEIAPKAEVLLLESSHRIGGVVNTIHRDGYLIEEGADNFLATTPTMPQLCDTLGLSGELIRPTPSAYGAKVVRRGRLEPIPAGFTVMAPSRLGPLVTTRILSPLGKLRCLLELLVPRRRRSDADESLGAFVTRRFGKELFERLVQPLVGGIYTADARRLSAVATMPRFVEMERTHRSLIRAMLLSRGRHSAQADRRGGARYGSFQTFRNGMGVLTRRLAERLPPGSVRLQTAVEALRRHDRGWTVTSTAGEPFDADAVVLATPPHHAGRLLESVDERLGAAVVSVRSSSCAVVSLGFRRDQATQPLDSYGVVAPAVEDRSVLSCSFSSVKYAGRAPDDSVLLRNFLGGALNPELVERPDEELIDLARREAESLLGFRGEPSIVHVSRRRQSMPQYEVGHPQLIERIRKRVSHQPRLALAGAYLNGPGVPGCIESAHQAADAVVEELGTAE